MKAAWLVLVLACAAIVMVTIGASPAAATTFCSPTVSNPVACENSLPGDTPANWQVKEAGDPSIQGYATSMSVNLGGTIQFKINTPSSKYHIDILRLGYYGGDGARMIASDIQPSVSLPQTQPPCLTEASTGLIDCGNWSVSASWTVPTQAVSGVYIAHLVRDDAQDPGGDSQIMFVVRNDSSHSDVLVQTSDSSWEAYNDYGGNSLYTCTVHCPAGNPQDYKGADAVSYNRPFDGSLTTDGGASDFYYAEYQLVRFLEANGYNASYTSESEVDASGALLKNHKLFISSGHDEYWSAGQRANVQSALAAGVNLAFFSGNEMFWKTRWGPSIDGSNTPDRTLTTYKETHFDAQVDPQDPPTWTGAWDDPRFSPPGDGGVPENALTGQEFEINDGTSDIQVPYTDGKLRLWRNTSVANLTSGQMQTLAPGTGTLGYEWDEDEDNGFRPAGEFDLSSTTVSGLQAFTDYGTETATEQTATHHLTLYRAPSGALVFGAGTVQWSWGLDNTNAWDASSTDPSGNPPDPTMQQATVNLLADMGAQPATLMAGLTAATQSTDTTPPQSTITSPANNATLTDGAATTITGTATDSGGVVAGVEVSTNNGASWHPTKLTTPDGASVQWSYAWIAHGDPSTTLKSRAVDDSANLETPASGVSVNVSCPCSIWGSNVTPGTVDSNASSSIEVGVQFRADVYGKLTGVSFYKAAVNTGTHVGSLWSASGTLLAKATFTNETTSGWQHVTFSSPVYLTPNTTYVAGYLAPKGHYSYDYGYFESPPPTGPHALDAPPLHALPANASTGNGVFAYANTPTFPTNTFFGSNYWVDVSFTPVPAPGQVTNVVATAGPSSATVSWSAPSTGGAPSQYTITPYIGSTAQAATTVSGSVTSTTVSGLTAGTSYTFVVGASNPSGSGPASGQSNPVTPTSASVPGAPTGVSASPASSQAQVSWNAPASNGGSAITGYIVTPFVGSTAGTPVTINNPASTSTTITGLNNATSYTFQVSAINQIGAGNAGTSNAVTPEDTIFDFSGPTGSAIDPGDTSSVEVGVQFSSEVAGQITGIRFYKATANTGTHIGSLWSTNGTLLAQATFTNETASGWQTVQFSNPVTITPNTTYIAGYLDPNGHYSATGQGFANTITNPPLRGLANNTANNGIFAYTTTSTFPTLTYNADNYWVDILFTPAPTGPPGQVTNVVATAGPSSATVSWSAPSTGGAPSQYTITPYIGSTAQAATTVSGSVTSTTVSGLTAGTSYTFVVGASNPSGSGPASGQSNPVTPTSASVPGAPTGVSASPASSQAQVSWNAPASNGGSAITGYIVTPFVGSTAGTPVTINNPASTSTTITGLNNATSYTFQVSAINQIGAGNAGTSNAVTPEDTIFDFSGPTGSAIDPGDTSSVEVGVQFSSEVAGQITGIRFYKATANTGTHIGSLWSTNGTLLAQATFTNETASGWQTVQFSNPVTITPNTTYIAGYLDPNGHYSATGQGFANTITNPPLRGLANNTANNGIFAYTTTSTFPTLTYNADNYWVDILFTPAPTELPGQPTNVNATAGNSSATVSWSVPSTGGAPSQYTITPYTRVGEATNAQAATTVSGALTSATVSGLTAGTSYTFVVGASNPSGSGPASGQSNPVTPTSASVPGAPTGVSASPASSQAQVSWNAPASNGGSAITGYIVTPFVGSTAGTPVTINNPASTSTTITGLNNATSYTFQVSAINQIGAGNAGTSNAVTPEDTIFDFSGPTGSAIDPGDTSSVEVGVQFSSEVAGQITGIRFYKATANTGTHIGSLWSTNGTLLAQATFTNETASGWQTVQFSNPVTITPNTTYIAGYLDPNGHYSATGQGFANTITNPPLRGLANNTANNGIFAYTTTSTFPTLTYNADNYWVDILFTPAPTGPPGQVTNVVATAGPSSATVSWSAPSTGGAPSQYTITPYIGSTAQAATTVSGSVTSTTVSGLTAGTSYTFVVGASNPSGSGPASGQSNPVTPTSASVPGAPTGVSASPASSQAQVSWNAPASNGGSAITGYIVTPFVGSTAGTPVTINNPASTSTTITGLNNATSYTFQVSAINQIGAGNAGTSNAVTPEDTIFDFSGPTGSAIDPGDTSSVEVGVQFSSEVAGQITGIRFYKATANTGTHIGSLWSTNGTLLAQATFTNESASGWQTVQFSNPVTITPNTTYIAGYLDPNGHYSATGQGFANTITNPPLRGLANNTANNGIFAYTTTSTFPTLTYNADNYWVDILFTPSS